MFPWQDRLNRQLQDRRDAREKACKESNEATDKEEPNAVDEFGAADLLDNKSRIDEEDIFLMEDALEDLRARHLPFRRPEKCDECDLDELRLQILTEVTSSLDFEDYYHEAWDVPHPGSNMPTTPPILVRRIAVMQIELMARAFSVLELQRFGNAPENRGWMVLFRTWGRSRRFQKVFEELKATLSPDFADFYRLYLHDLPAQASQHRNMPVHHPWLRPPGARGVGFFMDSGIVEGEIDVEVRPATGGKTDPGGSNRPDQTFEKPSDSGESGGSQSAPNE